VASQAEQGRKVKGKVISVPNQVPRHEDVWENGGIAPRVHNLSTGWW